MGILARASNISALLQTRWHTHHIDPNAKRIELHFRLRDGTRQTVTVPKGLTVLEAAHTNEVPLEGACEASLACSTCHVITSDELFDELPEACENEEDLLDLAPGLT